MQSTMLKFKFRSRSHLKGIFPIPIFHLKKRGEGFLWQFPNQTYLVLVIKEMPPYHYLDELTFLWCVLAITEDVHRSRGKFWAFQAKLLMLLTVHWLNSGPSPSCAVCNQMVTWSNLSYLFTDRQKWVTTYSYCSASPVAKPTALGYVFPFSLGCWGISSISTLTVFSVTANTFCNFS